VAILAAHTAFWHDLWPVALISVNAEPMLEQFFYVETYKFMSMTMPGRAVYDLEGPFYIAYTGWVGVLAGASRAPTASPPFSQPDFHWDLNVQEQYYTSLTGNRLPFMFPLIDMLHDNIGNLINNVGAGWPVSCG
jgi:hypothetical protein